jgi:hypothetical protein
MTSIRELLALGGIPEGGINLLIAGDTEHKAPRFQPLLDPSTTEELGRRLAGEVSRLQPDRLLIAGEATDEILAFVVGRELGCDVTVVWSSEGLLTHDGEMLDGDRVVVISESFRLTDSLHGLGSYISYCGATLAAAAVLIDTPMLQREAADLGVQTIALVGGH